MDDTTRKLENIDERQRQLELLNVKMSSMLERHDDSLNEHSERLTHLEERKMVFWDKFFYIVLAALAGGLISRFLELIIN